MFRDSLRTLQFIVEAILYYNPIKIFLVICAGMLGLALVCFADAVVFRHDSAFWMGFGCVALAVLMSGIGLISIQIKQLLHLQDTERTGRARAQK